MGAWMYVCCECCVLSGRGLCDELIAHPEESYRLWCVVVCDLEKLTSWMRRRRPTRGLSRQVKKKIPLPSLAATFPELVLPLMLFSRPSLKCWADRCSLSNDLLFLTMDLREGSDRTCRATLPFRQKKKNYHVNWKVPIL